ncbi:MAG: hypothetical protein ACRC7S_17460 [Cetobacterium sp.]
MSQLINGKIEEDIYCMAMGGVPYSEIGALYGIDKERVPKIISKRKNMPLSYSFNFDLDRHSRVMAEVLKQRQPIKKR